MQIQDDIPAALRGPATATLAWLNETHGSSYELTGLVDSDAALDAAPGEPFELGLVLCDGELCAREQVHVQPDGDAYRFNLVEAPSREIPPLLDPPAGVRRSWLDEQLEKFEFVLLLYYRGRW